MAEIHLWKLQSRATAAEEQQISNSRFPLYDVCHVHLSLPLPLPLSIDPTSTNPNSLSERSTVFHHSPIQMLQTAMASSEGATDVSMEERLERKRFELAGMITILAKRC